MRKAISVFIAILLVGSLMAMPVFAHPNASYGDVPMSADEIIIDGIKDAVYEQGLRLELYRQWEGYGDPETDTRGTAWLLWREGYLYIFAEITQGYLQDVFEAEGRQSGEPWMTDSLEIFIDPMHEGENSEQYRVDAWGYRSFENRFTGDNSYGGDETAADGFFEGAARIDGTNYNVEFRIPTTRGAGDAIGFLMQINYIGEFGDRSMIFSGSSNGEARSWEPFDYDHIVLSANVVSAAAAEEEAPEEYEAGEEDEADEYTPTPITGTAAPQTADPVTFIALGTVIISAAGAVIAKKRK